MRFIYFLFVVLFIFGCKQKSNELESDVFTIYPLKSMIKVKDLSDFVHSVEVIPLELTENSLVSYLIKLLITNKKEYIIISDKSLIKFDGTGNYICSYGMEGRGPGEYSFIVDACISYDQKYLYVLDYDKKILIYDLDNGNFIDIYDIPNDDEFLIYNGIIPSENGIIIFRDCPNNVDTTHYKMVEYDFEGKMLNQLLLSDQGEFPYISVGMMVQTFQGCLFKPVSHKSFLLFSDGKLSERVIVDYENKYLSDSDRNKMEWEDYMNLNLYKRVWSVRNTEEFFYYSVLGPKRTVQENIYSILNRIGIYWEREFDSEEDVIYIAGSDNEYFYALFDNYNEYSSEEIRKIYDPLTRTIIEQTGLVLNDKTDNPALIRFKIKNL